MSLGAVPAVTMAAVALSKQGDTDVKSDFKAAVKFIATASKEDMMKARKPLPPMDNLPGESKLTFYAYFKQATEGPNNKPQPAFYFPVERAKWNSWKQLKDMDKTEAMTQYCSTLTEYLPEWRRYCSHIKEAETNGNGKNNAVSPDQDLVSATSVSAPEYGAQEGKRDEEQSRPTQPQGIVPIESVPEPMKNGGALSLNAPVPSQPGPGEGTSKATAVISGAGSEYMSASSRMKPPSGAITVENEFEAAVAFVTNAIPSQKERARGTLPPLKAMHNEMQLVFYSLFKQATDGPCTRGPPPMYQAVERAKWEAWRKLGYMSKADAMKQYVKALQAEFPDWGVVWAEEGSQLPGTLSSLPSSSHIHVEKSLPKKLESRGMSGSNTGSPSCRTFDTALGVMLGEDEADGTMTLNNNSFSSVSEELREEIQELRIALRRVETAVRESKESAEASNAALRAELARVTKSSSSRQREEEGSSSSIGSVLRGMELDSNTWVSVQRVTAVAVGAYAAYSAFKRLAGRR